MNGRAPKTSCAGFHSCPRKNPVPKRSSVGIALLAIMTNIAATISRMLAAAKSRTVRKILSPKAPVCANLLSERFAAVRYRIDFRLNLLQDVRRQRSVVKLGRVLLAVMQRPPEKVDKCFSLRRVRLIFVNKDVRV